MQCIRAMKETSGTKKVKYATVLQRQAELHRLKPDLLQSYPKALRMALGWIVMILFTLAFLQPVVILALPFPFMWRGTMFYATSSYLSICVLSLLIPEREVPLLRCIGQLLYEIVDLHTNLNQEDFDYIMEYGTKHRMITCMHPHGIVPFQALLWAAYCDQYLNDLYGFGATADIVFKIPFLRNLLSALSAGSAGYKVLLAGLQHGISKPVNAAGRKPKHMYILPGAWQRSSSPKEIPQSRRLSLRAARISVDLQCRPIVSYALAMCSEAMTSMIILPREILLLLHLAGKLRPV